MPDGPIGATIVYTLCEDDVDLVAVQAKRLLPTARAGVDLVDRQSPRSARARGIPKSLGR